MLAVLAAQVGTGLVIDDEIAVVGPLNRFVESATGLAAAGWHRGLGQYALLALVAVHVLAIGVYALRGKPLVPAMITGVKQLPDEVPSVRDGFAVGLRALLVVVLCGALAVVVARLG
jgi:cytochrome b